MNRSRRVVITGLGALTPLGLSMAETWPRLIRGESGLAPITFFDAGDLPVRFAGELKNFDATHYLDRKLVRRSSRCTHLALIAAQEAMRDSGLKIGEIDATSIGVNIGTGVGALDRTIDGLMSVADGSTRANPFGIISALDNMPAALISAHFNTQGPLSTTVAACASGLQAIGEAAETIKRGWAQVMIAGGTDALVLRVSIVGFAAMGVLAKDNDHPAQACRPFDLTRDGLVLSEGSGIVILEEYDHALKRGAHIYVEVLGSASTSDTHSLAEPDPSGQHGAQTIQAAIERSRLLPTEIDYIHAHGTGTQANDAAETRAIKLVLKDAAYQTPVSSIKAMVGHAMGASGAIGLAVTAKAIIESLIPPTINYRTPDPECDLDYVPNVARSMRIDTALINAFGLGGQNACVVIRKTPEV
jgi:beta-ketoacyl-acyl-carrier-protein synthase II